MVLKKLDVKFYEKKIICIIPARTNSKRFKNKNFYKIKIYHSLIIQLKQH